MTGKYYWRVWKYMAYMELRHFWKYKTGLLPCSTRQNEPKWKSQKGKKELKEKIKAVKDHVNIMA